MKKADTVILVVSVGTMFTDTITTTIGAIEGRIAESYPEYEVRRAFTSRRIIEKLKENDGLKVESVHEALDKALCDGVKKLIIQPTHLLDGEEYAYIRQELAEYEGKFDTVILGKPLLTSPPDLKKIAHLLGESSLLYDDGRTAICFVGHGSDGDSNDIYLKLQCRFWKMGYENHYVVTLKQKSDLNFRKNYQRIVLWPLMLTAGNHVRKDLAGTADSSWRKMLEKEGYEVLCIFDGLGQNPEIQKMYVEHVKAAIGEK